MVALLLADDDARVRESLAKLLRRHGFEVDTADNGVAAFAEVQQKPYDVIVSDIRMPFMNGIRFFERLSAEDPDRARRVIFITGYAKDLKVREFLQRAGQPVLEKPFDVVDLVRAVRSVTRPDD